MELIAYDACDIASNYIHKSFTNHIPITFPDTMNPSDTMPTNKMHASAVMVYTVRKTTGRDCIIFFNLYQGGDRTLKLLGMYYFFSVKTCTKSYDRHKMSKQPTGLLIKHHSSTYQTSFVHPPNVRPLIKHHSSTCQFSFLHMFHIIRPHIKYHSSMNQMSFVHTSNANLPSFHP